MKHLVIVFALLFVSPLLAQFEPSEAREFTVAAPSELGTLPEGIGLAPGEKAPDVGLHSIHDRPVALSGLWEQQPIMLVFYRGGWCPYCNGQIRELTVRSEDFAALGVQPVLVSVDKPEASLALKANYDIPFPVLSDSELVALNA